jgi:transcriptional regulator with XRE-family HTH domain
MGRAARRKPERLAEKLLAIRHALALSQSEMLARLDCRDELTANHISKFELDKHEPSLSICYGTHKLRAYGVDVLINDDLDLPAKLPCSANTGHEAHGRQGRVK